LGAGPSVITLVCGQSISLATEGELESLPGLQKDVAKKIAAGRPYKTPEELVTKKILSKASFEKIKHLVEVKP
jgi:DNA uptake protein ComE-like DNA-binding protein